MIRNVVFAAIWGALGSAALHAQDAITLGNGKRCIQVPRGTSKVVVPIFLRDVPDTKLNRGDGSLNRIHGFSFEVLPAPTSSIALKSSGRLAITTQRAGVIASMDPVQDGSNSTSQGASFFTLFGNRSPVPLTLNQAPPGDLVAEMTVGLAPGLAAGSKIDLLTAAGHRGAHLTNVMGSVAESSAENTLLIHPGCIEVIEPEGGTP